MWPETAVRVSRRLSAPIDRLFKIVQANIGAANRILERPQQWIMRAQADRRLETRQGVGCPTAPKKRHSETKMSARVARIEFQ